MTADGPLTTDVKKVKWFGDVRTREQAARVIKWSAIVFYAFAALHVWIALSTGPRALVVVAALIVVCAVVLQTLKSRTAAIILLAWVVLVVIGTGSHLLQGTADVSRALFVLLVFINAITVVRVTFVYHSRENTRAAVAPK